MKTFCAGSSLIESMVALAVFAVGSAAAGTWVSASVATDAKASRLNGVVSAAVDLRERVRANVDAVVAGHYEVELPGVLVVPRPDCARGCGGAALAADDLHQFREALVAVGGPLARFSLHCVVGEHCELDVAWRGNERFALSFTANPVRISEPEA